MAVFHDNQPWESKIQHYAHKININADGIPVPSKADVKNIPIIEEEPLKIECKHFIDCIASGEVPRTDGQEGLRVLKVLQAAQDSLNSEVFT